MTKRPASPDIQAKAHLEALARVREFDDVRVWSRTPEHAKRFAAEQSLPCAVQMVVTATNAREPILRGAWLKPGAHVNAVGSPRPTWRELDDEGNDEPDRRRFTRGGVEGVGRQ